MSTRDTRATEHDANPEVKERDKWAVGSMLSGVGAALSALMWCLPPFNFVLALLAGLAALGSGIFSLIRVNRGRVSHRNVKFAAVGIALGILAPGIIGLWMAIGPTRLPDEEWKREITPRHDQPAQSQSVTPPTAPRSHTPSAASAR